MSAGFCGKRVGFEDIFGSASSQAPSLKRSRCSDIGFGSEDKLSALLRMFPSLDPKVVESVLDSHDNKIDDAIKNLNALCLGDDCATGETIFYNKAVPLNDHAIEGGTINLPTEEAALNIHDENLENSTSSQNVSLWVDLFVQEMMNASNWDDVRSRTTKLLEALERSVVSRSMTLKEEEIVSIKEQLQCMLRDNNILKKGIQIQHECNLEQEENLKEAPQLKHFISQCQEQIQKLEMQNYVLRMHLQRAQEPCSIPSHFN